MNVLFEEKPMAYLGLDIGGTSVKAALIGAAGAPLGLTRSFEYKRPAIDALIEAVASAIPECGEPIDAVGLCVPGLLDAGKTRVEYSANLPALHELPLREIISRALACRGIGAPERVVVQSDAAAAAFGYWSRNRPSGRPSGRLLALSLGTGVGAAVIDDGEFLRVTGESSGHIGQLDVSLETGAPIGPDAGRGGLEAYIGVPALQRSLGDDFASKLGTLDATAAPIRALARALRICHAIYRPHEIALLGYVGLSLAPAAATLRHAVDTDLTRVARPDWRLCFADSLHLAAEGVARLAAR
jgi:glucokinase